MTDSRLQVRPGAADFGSAPCFDSLAISCLRYLATIYEKTDPNKATFMKGLSQHLKTFPKRVIIKKVLPVLIGETRNTVMVPFVLPNIMIIAEVVSIVEFESLIFESLLPLFGMVDPPQILSIFLHKFGLLLTKAPAAKVKEHVFPMLYRALDGEGTALQNEALQVMPGFQADIDYALLKHEVIPRILQLCMRSGVPGIRIACLVCIGKMMPSFDKWFMQETIWPFLLGVPGQEPGVIMSVCGIVDIGMKDPKYGLDANIAATQLLPHVSPMVTYVSLNATQTAKVISVIRGLVKVMEHERVHQLVEKEKLNQEAADSVTIARGQGTEVSEGAMSSLFQAAAKTFDVGAASRAAAESDAKSKAFAENKELAAAAQMMPVSSHGAATSNGGMLGSGSAPVAAASSGNGSSSLIGGMSMPSAGAAATGAQKPGYASLQGIDPMFAGMSSGSGGGSSGGGGGMGMGMGTSTGMGMGMAVSSSAMAAPSSAGGGVFGAGGGGGGVFGAPASSVGVFGSSSMGMGGNMATPSSTGGGVFGAPVNSSANTGGGVFGDSGGGGDPFAAMTLGGHSAASTMAANPGMGGIFAGMGAPGPAATVPPMGQPAAAQDLLGGLLMPSSSAQQPPQQQQFGDLFGGSLI